LQQASCDTRRPYHEPRAGLVHGKAPRGFSAVSHLFMIAVRS